MKRIGMVLVALLMLVNVSAITIYAATTTPEESTTITILHTNDLHGRFVSSSTAIGMDTIAAIHAATPNSILVDAGDTIHGLPFVTFNQGANAIELMNAAGYSFFAPGNHDFNYGMDWLLQMETYAEFDFIAANLTWDDGSSAFNAYSIVEVDGVSVGFFGLVYPGTPSVTNPVGVEGLSFGDPIEAAQHSVAALQAAEVDVIVALAHLGVSGSAWGREVARAVPEIDVLIDGHSHSRLDDGYWVGDVLIAQAGAHGQYVGVVDIVVYNGEVISRTASLIDREMSEDFAPINEITAMIDRMEEELGEILNEVVGYSPITLFGDDPEHRPALRSQEVPIGNLIADANRWAMGADFALQNSGGIRYHIHAGDITKGDIIAVLAFFNYAVVIEITPAQLWEALEIGVSSPGHGRFPQVSGFSFVFDQDAPEGERVRSVTADDGTNLGRNDNTTVYTLVINNFTAVGGDDYTVFIDLPVLAEGGTLDELLIEYMAAHDISNIGIEGRIINVAAGDVTQEPEQLPDTTPSPLDSIVRRYVDGVAFVPMYAVAAAHDALVEWDGSRRAVIVTTAAGDTWYFIVGYQNSFLDGTISRVFVTYTHASDMFS